MAARGKPKTITPDVDTSRVDDEGTPDIYRNLINKLKRYLKVNEPIKETMSLDWRAERQMLPKMIARMSKQPAWIPRVGELVLFVRKISPGQNIRRDQVTGVHARYDSKTLDVAGPILWEAGVVGQSAEEDVELADLVMEAPKKFERNYSGFRVEPLPDPNGTNKDLSLQHQYLPLHHLRPFFLYKEFLRGTDKEEWHPTVNHCRTLMSSFSLVGKYHFKGEWPTASISCHGIYIGSELILVGDVVRLLPKPYEMECTDVLKVTAIKLKLSKLDRAGDDDYDDKHPYNSVVHITGIGFTSLAESQSSGWSSFNSEPEASVPEAMKGYGKWYAKHSAKKMMEIPFSRVIGRCFEAEAMMLWLPETADGSPVVDAYSDIAANLTSGLEGIREAREFSTETDKRIKHENSETWFWGDSRIEVLGVTSFNGQDVGTEDMDRDPSNWRKQIRVLEGVADAQEREELKQRALEQRPLRGYLAHNALVRSAFDDLSGQGESSTTTRESSPIHRKRSHSAAQADDDSEQGSTEPRRKRLVQVLID